jgi:hypothetical protein
MARSTPLVLLVLALTLFGIAYTSFSRSPMTTYWIVIAPLIGIICGHTIGQFQTAGFR